MEIIRAHRTSLLFALLLGSASLGTWTSWAVVNHSWPFCGGSIIDAPMNPMNVQNLTQTSNLVVPGSIDSVGPSWKVQTGRIVTNVSIMVSEFLKPQGGAGATKIVASGGTIGCYSETVGSEPDFTTGESVVLFLVQSPDGYARVTGGAQGKYTVSNGVAYPAGGSASPMALNDLISEIRQYS